MPIGSPSASCSYKGLNRGITTDENGSFRFDNICAGRYIISISMLGYVPFEEEIDLNKDLRREFTLENANIILEGVTVEGHSEKESIQSKSTLKGIDLQNTRGSSLAVSLQKLPGVSIIQTGPSISKPVIHGLHSNRILILNNGVRLEGQQWGSEHAPEIDPFVASQVSIVKGAASVRYGSDAIGGVIMVQPKSLPTEAGIGGEVNLVGITNGWQGITSGLVEGSIGKIKGLSFRLQGTYKKAGNGKTPGYYLKNTGFQELNFSSEVGYHKNNFGVDVFFSRFDTRIGIFTGSHIGNITDLQTAIKSQQPLVESGFSYKIKRPYQEVNHSLLKVNTHYKFDRLGTLHFIYALQDNQRREYDAHRPKNDSLASLNRPEVDFQLSTQTGELILEHRKLGNISGSIGITGMKQVNVFVPLTRRLIPNFRSYNGGVFLIERYVRERVELEAGVRHDYKWLKTFDRKGSKSKVTSHTFDFENYTGTVGALYRIDHHWILRGNVASAWRAPNVNELFFYGRHHGSGRFIKGDSTLNSESSYNFNTSLTFNGHGLDIEITPYLNYIFNYIYLKPETYLDPETGATKLRFEQTINGAFPSFYYTQTHTNFKGVDVSLEYIFLKRFTFRSTSSIVRALNTKTGEHIEYIPADRFQNSLAYAFKDWKNITNLSLSLSNTYVSKQSRAPKETDFLPAPNAYSLFNADVNFSIAWNHQHADISLSMNNILNTRYRDYLNTFRYYSDEMGRSFVMRVKIPFQFK